SECSQRISGSVSAPISWWLPLVRAGPDHEPHGTAHLGETGPQRLRLAGPGDLAERGEGAPEVARAGGHVSGHDVVGDPGRVGGALGEGGADDALEAPRSTEELDQEGEAHRAPEAGRARDFGGAA